MGESVKQFGQWLIDVFSDSKLYFKNENIGDEYQKSLKQLLLLSGNLLSLCQFFYQVVEIINSIFSKEMVPYARFISISVLFIYLLLIRFQRLQQNHLFNKLYLFLIHAGFTMFLRLRIDEYYQLEEDKTGRQDEFSIDYFNSLLRCYYTGQFLTSLLLMLHYNVKIQIIVYTFQQFVMIIWVYEYIDLMMYFLIIFQTLYKIAWILKHEKIKRDEFQEKYSSQQKVESLKMIIEEFCPVQIIILTKQQQQSAMSESRISIEFSNSALRNKIKNEGYKDDRLDLQIAKYFSHIELETENKSLIKYIMEHDFNNAQASFPYCKFKADQRIDVQVVKTKWENETALLIILEEINDKIEKLRLGHFEQFKLSLLSSMSHNLKTPLNAIELLMEHNKDFLERQTQARNAQLIKNQFREFLLDLEKMLIFQKEQINQILQFQGYQGNKSIPQDYGWFKLDDLTNTIRFLFEKQLKMRNLELVINKDPTINEIYNSQVKLQQIIITLMENSLKFSEKGGKIVIDFAYENTNHPNYIQKSTDNNPLNRQNSLGLQESQNNLSIDTPNNRPNTNPQKQLEKSIIVKIRDQGCGMTKNKIQEILECIQKKIISRTQANETLKPLKEGLGLSIYLAGQQLKFIGPEEQIFSIKSWPQEGTEVSFIMFLRATQETIPSCDFLHSQNENYEYPSVRASNRNEVLIREYRQNSIQAFPQNQKRIVEPNLQSTNPQINPQERYPDLKFQKSNLEMNLQQQNHQYSTQHRDPDLSLRQTNLEINLPSRLFGDNQLKNLEQTLEQTNHDLDPQKRVAQVDLLEKNTEINIPKRDDLLNLQQKNLDLNAVQINNQLDPQQMNPELITQKTNIELDNQKRNNGERKIIEHELSQPKKAKILIVDDETFNIIALKKYLEKFKNLEISTAINGQVALEMIQNLKQFSKQKYDVIFMDINMPKMDGITSTRLIKQMIPDQVIIVNSAYTSQKYIELSHESGANLFIEKPITNAKFNQAISILNLNEIFQLDH